MVKKEVNELVETALRARLPVIPDDLLDASARDIAKATGVSEQKARAVLEKSLQQAINQESEKALRAAQAASSGEALGLRKGEKVFLGQQEGTLVRPLEKFGKDKVLVNVPDEIQHKVMSPFTPNAAEIGENARFKPFNVTVNGPDGKVALDGAGKPVQRTLYTDGTNVYRLDNRLTPPAMYPEHQYKIVDKSELSKTPRPQAATVGAPPEVRPISQPKVNAGPSEYDLKLEQLKTKLAQAPSNQALSPGTSVIHDGKSASIARIDPTSGHYLVKYDNLKFDPSKGQIVDRFIITDKNEVDSLKALPPLGDGERYFRNDFGDVYKKVKGPNGEVAQRVTDMQVVPREDVSVPAVKPEVQVVPKGLPAEQPKLSASESIRQNYEYSGPIENGSEVPWSLQRNADGTRTVKTAVVVDRANDPVLDQYIKNTVEKYRQQGFWPPKNKDDAMYLIKRLSDNVNQTLSKGATLSDKELDETVLAMLKPGNMKLGDFIQAGTGVCNQQSILLKVLVDEVNKELPEGQKLVVTLQSGTMDATKLGVDHMWVTVDFSGYGGGELIYDPRGSNAVKPEGSGYKTGKEIEEEARRLREQYAQQN